jgi:RHS repeat-associated protein
MLTYGTQTFSYDATGNRTMTGYTTTTDNELKTDGTYSYTYDDEGNEITKTKISTGDYWTYGYDNKNELTSAVEKTSGGTLELSVNYVYDALGNRIEEDVTPYTSGVAGATTATRFAYDDWDPALAGSTGNTANNVWADLTGSSSLASRYIRGDEPDQLFARVDKVSGTLTPYWYLTDNQQSVRNVLSYSGTVLGTVTYDAFGNATETGSDIGRYTYTGREWDSETNLLYNRARYYDPRTGRWMSQDPLGFDAGDSNLYRYVHNQPTERMDPSGLIDVKVVEVNAPILGLRGAFAWPVRYKLEDGKASATLGGWIAQHVTMKIRVNGVTPAGFPDQNYWEAFKIDKGGTATSSYRPGDISARAMRDAGLGRATTIAATDWFGVNKNFDSCTSGTIQFTGEVYFLDAVPPGALGWKPRPESPAGNAPSIDVTPMNEKEILAKVMKYAVAGPVPHNITIEWTDAAPKSKVTSIDPSP